MTGVQWGLGVPQTNALTGYLQGVQQGTAMRNAREDRSYQLAERDRIRDAREARAAYMLAGPPRRNALVSAADQQPLPPPPVTANALVAPAPSTQPGSERDDAFARFAQADPEGAAASRREEATTAFQRLRNYQSMNEMSMQWLAGVSDQAGYDQARRRSRALLEQFGEDPSAIDQLPAQWTPQLGEQLRMQGMSASRQLAGQLQRMRLEWDIEDDQLDNERADEALGDLSEHRRQTRGLTARGQDMTDARGRRGQDLTDGRRRRDGFWLRGRGRGRSSRGGSGGSGATAVGPNGQRIYLRGNRWVDAQGQPVQ